MLEYIVKSVKMNVKVTASKPIKDLMLREPAKKNADLSVKVAEVEEEIYEIEFSDCDSKAIREVKDSMTRYVKLNPIYVTKTSKQPELKEGEEAKVFPAKVNVKVWKGYSRELVAKSLSHLVAKK
jgi:hypothetical protein